MLAVDVRHAVGSRIHVDAGQIALGPSTLRRADFDRLLIVAVGKASLPMYQAAAASLRDAEGLSVEAVVVGPDLGPSSEAGATFLPGAHPTPDERSVQAAASVLAKLKTVTPRTVVLFLLSGGASAMMEQPLEPRLTLQEMAALHRALVGSGLPIAAINAVRKHVSAVKGGRLAVAASLAHAQVTLLVSDVPDAAPDAIGSGPSLPDTTTLADCRSLLLHVAASAALPLPVLDFFASPLCKETPGPGDPAFARAAWSVILSSDHLAAAAASAAQAAGYHVEIDNTCDEWEYRAAARHLLDRSAALARLHPRTCLISVGEVGVALPPNPGEGGRNQQFALWCAAELARRGQTATVLSAGSDGIDGHSTAAGAGCSEQTVAQAAQLGLSVDETLATFNTAPLLRRLQADITTGPTGNNLRDLRLILTDRRTP
jgi:hydroxypyruvate reductase